MPLIWLMLALPVETPPLETVAAIAVRRVPQRWADAPKGSLAGRLVCSRPRPRPPIVVYLVRDGGELTHEPSPRPLVVRQKGARFDPAFAVLVAGDKAIFQNDEEQEIDHNVYGLGADEFDLGIFPPGKPAQHVFRQPGEVAIHCSVHRLMDLRIFVAPSPAYAVLEGDATAFEIAEVPEGTYELRTWQKARRFKDAAIRLRVEAGKKTEIEVGLSR
jgi:plastocyanin